MERRAKPEGFHTEGRLLFCGDQQVGIWEVAPPKIDFRCHFRTIENAAEFASQLRSLAAAIEREAGRK